MREPAEIVNDRLSEAQYRACAAVATGIGFGLGVFLLLVLSGTLP